jgi:hypothetical protein
MATFPGWTERVLVGLGVKPTAARVHFLQAWAACEGGHATFNPLNTTMPLAAAKNYNSAGVKNFPDAIAGTAATLATLRLSYYAELRRALGAPNLTAAQIARHGHKSISSWGTNFECLHQRLGA